MHFSLEKPLNLFNSPNCDSMMVFKITSEKSLEHFWEYCLVTKGFGIYEERIFEKDFIQALYNIGTRLLADQVKFAIYMEEGKECFYFTIDAPFAENLEKDALEELAKWDKNLCIGMESTRTRCTLAVETDSIPHKLSAHEEKILSTQAIVHEHNYKDIEKKPQIIAEVVVEAKKQTEQSEQSQPAVAQSAPKQKVFLYMEMHDMVELGALIDENIGTMTLLQHSTIESEDFRLLGRNMSSMSKVLSTYNDTYEVAQRLRSLSDILMDCTAGNTDQSSGLSLMLRSFFRDIKEWQKRLCEKGVNSIEQTNKMIFSSVQELRLSLGIQIQ